MLIVTNIDNQPQDFRLIAQNMSTYEVCGYTEQTGFIEVDDIPQGFEQRVLAGNYGQNLTSVEIANFALIENGELKRTLDNADLAIINQYEVQVAQDAAIIEIYEMMEGR